jgi:hypothetical protein
MKNALCALLLALSASPAIAEAKVDFKCESVKYSDQIGGWVRFGYGGRGNSIQLEYWNGYPPITLVDTKMDNGKDIGNSELQFVSEPDRFSNDTVATLDAPAAAYESDKFEARVELSYISPETKKPRVSKYKLKCIRH